MSDDSHAEESSDDEVGAKRKLPQPTTPLKKVKYENITSKPSKKSKNDLYKAPTVEELNELKETQNLYNNNLFRLQIEELIKEVKIKPKHRKTFTAWFDQFQTLLTNLPEYNITLSDIKLKNKKKETDKSKLVNFIANKSLECDQDFIVKLIKPERSEIVGLDRVSALPGPKLHVDVNLKMPRDCFNVKDYLNNRYFVKRYYYLGYVFYYLKKQDLGGEITWCFHNDNELLPVVKVALGEKITIKIFATPCDNYFKVSRCGADINNVKINTFTTDEVTESATLFYNASLAHDLTLTINQNFVQESLSELPNAQEAIKLIYIWLVQRGLQSGLGAFTEDLIVYFVVYLVTKKRINKHMSSYQIIRNFWNFITETDLTQNPISLNDDLKTDVLDTFQANFDVVFLDKTGFYNVAAFLDVNVYRKIKTECGLAFKLLDDGGINSFHSLFITKLPLELQYDLILTLKSDSNFENILSGMDPDVRTKFLGFFNLFVTKNISHVLHRGFNKRASLIVPLVAENQKSKLLFGINLDPSDAFSILERGPALNDPEEKEFKEFWGDLTSDRR